VPEFSRPDESIVTMPDQRTEPTFDPDGLPQGGTRSGPQDPPAASSPATPPAAFSPAAAAQPPTGKPAQAAGRAADAQADESAARAEIESLQAEIAALQARNAELSEQALRAQAEMLNTRRRAEEEMSKARKFAVESFAESLLPVTDSLEAGLAIQGATIEQIREGSEATLRQLKNALERNKVLEINPVAGTKFDPHHHQAISVVPGSGQEANTIVGVLQKGYSIAERVLRPALVTVAGG
jgi:molecular chaperone GrpE